MTYQPDLVAYSPSNRPVLFVEIRGRSGADARVASAYLTNLLRRGGDMPSDYFLLAMPDRFFLWRGAASGAPPDYEIDPKLLLEPYQQQGPPSGLALELIMGSLLAGWIRGEDAPGWLEESGLKQTLAGARLVYEEAA